MQPSIILDPAGFPMVWRDEVMAYVHWLPVTKIQFEHFLCAAPDAHFDARWYEAILGLNPRVTPRGVAPDNYWRALMTGVRPSEAQRFASWCGDGFHLPTESEWMALYQGLSSLGAVELDATGVLNGIDLRVRDLLVGLDAATREAARRGTERRTLADQMLLRHGAMEWVRVGDPPWGWKSKGEPFPAFCGNLEIPDESATAFAVDVESTRFRAAGFRLLRSRAATPEPDSEERRW